jgi:hypothetical protein
MQPFKIRRKFDFYFLNKESSVITQVSVVLAHVSTHSTAQLSTIVMFSSPTGVEQDAKINAKDKINFFISLIIRNTKEKINTKRKFIFLLSLDS